MLARSSDHARTLDKSLYRARAIAILAPQLTGEAREQALAEGVGAAITVPYEEDRVDAIAALAPHLAGTLLERALDATLAIADSDYRERVLPEGHRATRRSVAGRGPWPMLSVSAMRHA